MVSLILEQMIKKPWLIYNLIIVCWVHCISFLIFANRWQNSPFPMAPLTACAWGGVFRERGRPEEARLVLATAKEGVSNSLLFDILWYLLTIGMNLYHLTLVWSENLLSGGKVGKALLPHQGADPDWNIWRSGFGMLRRSAAGHWFSLQQYQWNQHRQVSQTREDDHGVFCGV